MAPGGDYLGERASIAYEVKKDLGGYRRGCPPGTCEGEVMAFKMFCGALLLAASLAGAAFAQDAGAAKPPAKRTILQRADVASSPDQETIFGTVEIAPGSGNGFHTHFGTEIGYVLQGHIRLEVKGEAPRELGPGDSFMVPRGMVHRSVLLGDEPAKLVNSWTVDKGKPLLTLAADQ
jgi:quercetin dioxygenase-like cupin family protein